MFFEGPIVHPSLSGSLWLQMRLRYVDMLDSMPVFFFYFLSLAYSGNQRNSLARWYPLEWVPTLSYSSTYVLSHPAQVLPNDKLQRYLRAFASWHGVNANDISPNISYNTRVELVEKSLNLKGEEIGWALTIKELVSTNRKTLRATWRNEVGGHILYFSFGG